MYYIGMMSGTSLDAVDAVLAHFTPEPDRASDGVDGGADGGVKSELGGQWQACHHVEVALPQSLKQTLYRLNFPDTAYQGGELHAAMSAEQQLTECYAEAYHALMAVADVPATAITAIGAHGQTVRHEPNSAIPYTLQLLDGAKLSYLSGQTVVCDFRRKDIAAGGQGAPLAPIFHRSLFDLTPPYAVVNIGGIANISIITADADRNNGNNSSGNSDGENHLGSRGFDCGPGNCLMDEWIMHHLGQPFDNAAHWATQGTVIAPLLSALLSDDYFALPAPKSTGRDYFHRAWLHTYLQTYLQAYPNDKAAPVDVMRTLLSLTATAIVDTLPKALTALVVVGGGAKNPLLLSEIKQQMHTQHCATTVYHGNQLGLDVQQVEALGFALLAQQCLDGQTIDTTAVTGAEKAIVCGAVYR